MTIAVATYFENMLPPRRQSQHITAKLPLKAPLPADAEPSD
jgi:hypothetical protein